MSFDKVTRTLLANQVGKARESLKADVITQLRRYGFQEDGIVLPLERIAGLTEAEQAAAGQLRELLEHLYASEHGDERSRRQAAFDRLAREIGFTTLNRLVALRMAEERQLIVESVGRGVNSDGFQLYERVANGALGDRAATYRTYIESLYDEIAVDLPALFDRGDPHSQVFPSERCLDEVLGLLNAPVIAHIWKSDESIGWVYQYYNDPDERKKMRETPAPRNSRELAVRNQFFTPRYVVEFLTDNTLGRTWYEMRQGETRLVGECQYMVRRKHPIWLPEGQAPQQPFPEGPDFETEVRSHPDRQHMWLRPNPSFTNFSKGLITYAQTIDGYTYASEQLGLDVQEVHQRGFERYRETGTWSGSFEELRLVLFGEQRKDYFGGGDVETDEQIAALNRALCAQWDLEVEEIPYRAKKDPRQLKVVDLAVGSGHFLLYSFDLLQTIYEEAWDDPDLGPVLHRDYGDRDAYLGDVPRLILERNLYGVDIDWRAAQIAQVALWLRAQRAWAEAGLAPVERPRVRRTRIVVAEPMPEGVDLLAAAKRRLDPRLHDLVDLIWQKMRLAGEAGSLLKIEDEIREAVRSVARKVGVVEPVDGSLDPGSGGLQKQTRLGLASSKSVDADFWVSKAEPAVLKALQIGAEAAEEQGAIRRRLFSNSAAHGFAFVDLCRLRFDVVLMNPPFGDASPGTTGLIESTYPNAKTDLAMCFVSRGLSLLAHDGLLGVISTRTVFLLPMSANWRREDLNAGRSFQSVADLGYGVLDAATVETAAYVLGRSDKKQSAWLRVVDEERKDSLLLSELGEFRAACRGSRTYLADNAAFASLPSSAFAYWASERALELFRDAPRFEKDGRVVRVGMDTLDDFRFVRLWWEVDPAKVIWVANEDRHRKSPYRSYFKGGDPEPFWVSSVMLLRWGISGEELKAFLVQKVGSISRNIRSESLYLKAGLTFGRRIRKFSPAVLPAGAVFSNSSNSIFFSSADEVEVLASLAILNSDVVRKLISFVAPVRKMEVSYIQNLPFPDPGTSSTELAKIAVEYIRTQRLLTGFLETSREFSFFPGSAQAVQAETSLRRIQGALSRRINEIAEEHYGVHADEGGEESAASSGAIGESDEDASETAFSLHSRRADVAFVLGLALGRWDVRMAKDQSLIPARMKPFDPLPLCAPGTLAGPDGWSATPGGIASEGWLRARPDTNSLPPVGSVVGPETIADADYPIPVPWDGLVIDDLDEPDHPRGLLGRIQGVLTVLHGDAAPVVEGELAAGVGARSLRDYLLKPSGFFADHLAWYSRPRR